MKEQKLTANDERILEEIQQIVRRNEKLTCAQIARRLQIAPSSIIKLAQKLGYTGWNDMFYSLSQMYNDNTPLSIDNMDFIGEGRVFEKIHQLLSLLEENGGRPVIVSCVGDSEFLTDYLMDMLGQRNFRVLRFSSEVLRRIQENRLEPGLCFFVNESGIALYGAGEKLEELGCRVIAVTSSSETPLASKASYAVEIRNRKSPVENYMPNFFAARVMIFLELLFSEMDASGYKPSGK